jgi:hypothetical protein
MQLLHFSLLLVMDPISATVWAVGLFLLMF